MATAAAPIVENPSNPKDLNLTPLSTDDARPSHQPSPSYVGDGESNGKPAGTELAVKSSDADVGGPDTDVQKKMKRAERFGMAVHLSEEDKRNTRAERFGTAAASALNGLDSSKQSEELKRKARAERFGVVQSTPTDDEVKKKARRARFGSSSLIDPAEEDKKKVTLEDKKTTTEEDVKKAAEEDKKKARALRFAQPDSSSKENGEKATGASKADGGT